jgi:hypothetical protein
LLLRGANTPTAITAGIIGHGRRKACRRADQHHHRQHHLCWNRSKSQFVTCTTFTETLAGTSATTSTGTIPTQAETTADTPTATSDSRQVVPEVLVQVFKGAELLEDWVWSAPNSVHLEHPARIYLLEKRF